jgi:pimeloyl-ACP methyl ester carboxylesterase
MSSELSYDGTVRELTTESGVLRYHEAGDGPPLLMLHGSGLGVTGWRNFGAVLPAFAEHFRCLILEFPGFGVSDDFGGHPMITAFDALGKFTEALQLDRVDIVGNSMGGGIGINYAIAAPEKVRRLVTIGGIGTNLLSPGPAEGIRLLQDFVENPTREALVRWMQSMVYDPAVLTEEVIEERWKLANDPETLANARRMYGKEAFAAMMKAMASSKRPPPWAMTQQVQAPTLITWGRDDRVSPLDMALIPMRTIPNAEFHVFPNCGHWTMIEAKDAFESVVLNFLRRA